jgi:DNA-binding response OmpR family regulator
MKKSILIVEDEETLLRALSEKLEREGFAVYKAINGEEGLRMAMENTPDLILLDLVMPRVDGMQMLNELRMAAWGKKIPIMILSNLSDERRVAESMEQGVHDYLIKTDWSLQEVVKKVRTKLGQK